MLKTLACMLLLGSVAYGADKPVVFWTPDKVAPGDVTLLYGDGLECAGQVRVWRLPDSPTKAPVAGAVSEVPSDAVSAQGLQPCTNSIKFVIPKTLKQGVFGVQVVAGSNRSAPQLLNVPELWFVQPTSLRPGLDVNQVPPGAEIQVVGKNFLLRTVEGVKPKLVLRAKQGGATIELSLVKSELYSLVTKLPEALAVGAYELTVHNGHGGGMAWSKALAVDVKAPDVWPVTRFNVRDFGAKGDDVTDDTKAVRAALAAADTNKGGVVFFPWGTYRMSNWMCIPPRTVVRGESRDSTLLKWPVDVPESTTNFMTAAIFGAPPYALEDLTIVVRKVDTALMDLSWETIKGRNVPPEVLSKMQPFGGFRDVFLRRVFFQHWLLCGHPETQPQLVKKYWEGAYNVRIGGVKNFEISDCVLWGANNYFENIRNARITGNAIANGMGGHSWTCLGGGAQDVVCERNDLNCSSSWGWGWIGLQRVYSAHNASHNFVRGEREAMTLDISALPTARPVSQHWGSPIEVGERDNKPMLRFADVKWTPGCFKDGLATIRAYDGGPGTNQWRMIVDNTSDAVILDKPFKPAPDVTPRKLYMELAPRHAQAHNGTTAWIGRLRESKGSEFVAADARWLPQEFVGMTAVVLDGKGAGQYRVITANSADHVSLERAWDVTPDTTSIMGVWSLMRHMIVYASSAEDTSSFAQLYGSFFDFTVDSCRVERSQGIWGQMGWFVQFRDNTVNFANSYHPGIGMPGPNPEKRAPFGYTGLTSDRLRITKSQAFQYPDRKIPVFVDEVIGHPLPATRGHILRGNTLSYNQRLVVQPWSSEKAPKPRPGGPRFSDIIIEGNRIEHSAVGIQLGADVAGAVLSRNTFEDVAQPIAEAITNSAWRIE
jgi:hypothetical protein